jgi:hypothetical protein
MRRSITSAVLTSLACCVFFTQPILCSVSGEGFRFGSGAMLRVSEATAASAVPLQNLAFRPDAVPIARVTEPYGQGLKDLSIIKDGILRADEPDTASYDSYDGANVAGEDWYGYTWSEQVYVDRLVYCEGKPSEAGGYWKSLTVQYTMDGTEWVEAGEMSINPNYDFADTPARTPYTEFELRFTGCLVRGVRIYGQPGGPAAYTSIAELEVYGTRPLVVCARTLPTSFKPGQNISVTLALIVSLQNPPANLTIAEATPAGLTVSDPGTGDTSVQGGIVWSFGEGQVVSQNLNYVLAVPADETGTINFSGTANYPGVAAQTVSGAQKIAPAPLPPSALQVVFDVDAHLSWQPNGEEGIAGYHVYRSEDGGEFADVSGLILETNYVDFLVEEGKVYQYKVVSHNTTGAQSEINDSQPSAPDGPSMTRRQFEDYDFEGGNFPGGAGQRGYGAGYRSDLDLTDFFYQNSNETNDYRPADSIAIPAFNAAEHHVRETTTDDWWRYTFDVPGTGYVKLGPIRAASEGDAVLEFLWEESHVGWLSFNTGGLYNWQILAVDIPAFESSAGPHTLRVMLSPGQADLDYFGIAFQQPAPARATIFYEDFESYTTTNDVTSPPDAWTIENGSGIPDGAWQLWSTTGSVLGYDSPDLTGMTGKYIISDGELAGPGELDERLVSPEIDCTGYVEITLQFCSNIQVYEDDIGIWNQVYDVDISAYNDGTHSWSNWENTFHHEGVDGDDASPPLVDLSAWADGNKIKLRWRFHEANYDYWWAVDNIHVTGKVPSIVPPGILSVAMTGNAISLEWESFGTGSYRVQYRDNLLSGMWADVPGTTWPISETQWSGDDVSAVRSRAYRVVSE